MNDWISSKAYLLKAIQECDYMNAWDMGSEMGSKMDLPTWMSNREIKMELLVDSLAWAFSPNDDVPLMSSPLAEYFFSYVYMVIIPIIGILIGLILICGACSASFCECDCCKLKSCTRCCCGDGSSSVMRRIASVFGLLMGFSILGLSLVMVILDFRRINSLPRMNCALVGTVSILTAGTVDVDGKCYYKSNLICEHPFAGYMGLTESLVTPTEATRILSGVAQKRSDLRTIEELEGLCPSESQFKQDTDEISNLLVRPTKDETWDEFSINEGISSPKISFILDITGQMSTRSHDITYKFPADSYRSLLSLFDYLSSELAENAPLLERLFGGSTDQSTWMTLMLKNTRKWLGIGRVSLIMLSLFPAGLLWLGIMFILIQFIGNMCSSKPVTIGRGYDKAGSCIVSCLLPLAVTISTIGLFVATLFGDVCLLGDKYVSKHGSLAPLLDRLGFDTGSPTALDNCLFHNGSLEGLPILKRFEMYMDNLLTVTNDAVLVPMQELEQQETLLGGSQTLISLIEDNATMLLTDSIDGVVFGTSFENTSIYDIPDNPPTTIGDMNIKFYNKKVYGLWSLKLMEDEWHLSLDTSAITKPPADKIPKLPIGDISETEENRKLLGREISVMNKIALKLGKVMWSPQGNMDYPSWRTTIRDKCQTILNYLKCFGDVNDTIKGAYSFILENVRNSTERFRKALGRVSCVPLNIVRRAGVHELCNITVPATYYISVISLLSSCLIVIYVIFSCIFSHAMENQSEELKNKPPADDSEQQKIMDSGSSSRSSRPASVSPLEVEL